MMFHFPFKVDHKIISESKNETYYKYYNTGDHFYPISDPTSEELKIRKNTNDGYTEDQLLGISKGNLTNDTIRILIKHDYYNEIENWITDDITDMSYLFKGKSNINFDLSKWRTENVTTMEGMFYNCYDFNGNIN